MLNAPALVNSLPAEITNCNILITAASWEDRCIGVTNCWDKINADYALITVYERPSERRSKNISIIRERLERRCSINYLPADYSSPISNVNNTVNIVKGLVKDETISLGIDISCYTRKHLLQLIQGLDFASLLNNCCFYYTEPSDYQTNVVQPNTTGVASVEAIETFTGTTHISNDSILFLMLGYEGRRAAALIDHIEPNIVFATIPDPPFHESWGGRTEAQNKYLLSTVPQEKILRLHSLDPIKTARRIAELTLGEYYHYSKYNWLIAPMGPKPQVLGVYSFMRKHLDTATIVYASPNSYTESTGSVGCGATWLLTNSIDML